LTPTFMGKLFYSLFPFDCFKFFMCWCNCFKTFELRRILCFMSINFVRLKDITA
jgi:hypothetical protein